MTREDLQKSQLQSKIEKKPGSSYAWGVENKLPEKKGKTVFTVYPSIHKVYILIKFHNREVE